MDKIWYRNPSKSEVIGRWGGIKKTNDHTEPTKKSNAKKKNYHPPQKNDISPTQKAWNSKPISRMLKIKYKRLYTTTKM